MSDARKQVENWVKGFTSSVRADTTASEGMEDFSLGKKKKAKKKARSVVVEEPPKEAVVVSKPPPIPDDDEEPDIPTGACGPKILPCGHHGWGTKKEHAAARAEGKCCAQWRAQPDWYTVGLTKPVPIHMRRSADKIASGGWPGMCCDPETGLYIGGIGNNCAHHHDGPERCVVHQKGGHPSKRGGRE